MSAVLIRDTTTQIRRNQVWLANFGHQSGSLVKGLRPCVVLSNNVNNKYSPVVMVVPISSAVKKPLPVHVHLDAETYNLDKNSHAMAEQIKHINKDELIRPLTTLDSDAMAAIEKAFMIQAGMHYALG